MSAVDWSRLRHDRRALYVAAAALVIAITALDFTTWIELDVASIYGLPLVVTAATRSRRLLWLLTAALAATTFVVYALQIPPGGFGLHEPYFVNRALDVVGVLLTAVLLDVWIRSVDVREAQMQRLDEQNRELEAVNAELRAREAQIAQQSAELEVRRREAEEASGRKTRLLASVSHDIRTPLNAIQLMATVLRRTADDPELAAQVPEMVERLQRNASSLMEVVSDLLDIAYFDSGRVERHESRFALGELIAEKCDGVLALAQARGLRVAIEAGSAPPCVYTDRGKLGRVITNLLANAIKYTREGSVRVAVTVDGDGALCIGVADTGVGIAPDKLERIFDEYAQLASGGERRQGWGLGLAICRRLVHLLGGTITASSTPNAGSVFTVRLPATCIVADGEPAPSSPPPGGDVARDGSSPARG